MLITKDNQDDVLKEIIAQINEYNKTAKVSMANAGTNDVLTKILSAYHVMDSDGDKIMLEDECEFLEEVFGDGLDDIREAEEGRDHFFL